MLVAGLVIDLRKRLKIKIETIKASFHQDGAFYITKK